MKVKIFIAIYAFMVISLASAWSKRNPNRSFLPAKQSALDCLSQTKILQYAKNEPEYGVDAELLHFALNLKKSRNRNEDQKAMDLYIDNFCSTKTTIKTQIEVDKNLKGGCRSAMKKCGTVFLNKLV